MTGPDLETMLRDALLRAQDEAPLAHDLLAGVARRRRARRRVAVALVVAAAATIAGVAVPVSVALTAGQSGHPAPVGPADGLVRGVSTPIGDRIDRWTMPLPVGVPGSAFVLDGHVFEIHADDQGTLIRYGDDGIHKLALATISNSPLEFTSNSTALYATDSNNPNNPMAYHVWRIDPTTLTVTATVTLPKQPQGLVASDSGVYWSTSTSVSRLDPATLANRGTYQVPMPRNHTVNGLVVDGSGVAAVAAAAFNKGAWMLPLSADLVPGTKAALPAATDLNPVGSACGVNFILSRTDSRGRPTTTVTLSGIDPAAVPFTVNGRFVSLATPCLGGRGYLGVDVAGRSVVVAFKRTGSHTYATTGHAAVLSPEDTLSSVVVSNGDLWIISQLLIDRIRPSNP